ncbi:MAG TPA: riboflavin synthase [Acidimicrobiia bacterium]|nr:riboflavin synthase [Acidimicrobiia bacterium]
MFTGIIEELGEVRANEPHADGARLQIACRTVLADATIGASIAVNGCCLTVVDRTDGTWTADVQPESLQRTTLGALAPGDPVNLERPVRLADRLGGHLVQGHVDAVGTVTARTPEADGSTRLTIRVPDHLARYLVEKGSVTVDGVSLTVTDTTRDTFGVALIPHTLSVTTLGARPSGATVNLEADVVAKYVERLLTTQP